MQLEATGSARSGSELAEIVGSWAARSGEWMERVRLRTDQRWYERIQHEPDYDVWVISWLPGQATGFHDHGSSSGAFVVFAGELEEHRHGEEQSTLRPGQVRAFGTDYTHDVQNASSAPALSIHAYSPPLTEMNLYELDGDELVPLAVPPATADTPGHDGPAIAGSHTPRRVPRRIDEVLASARTRLRRLLPAEAHAAVSAGTAALVDIRPAAQRAREGAIPAALVVERNVLEWRCDPASSWRLPVARNYDVQFIVVCSEGYTSSLAAAALQDLGLWRATDVVGGFHDWRMAGLPTTQSSEGEPAAARAVAV